MKVTSLTLFLIVALIYIGYKLPFFLYKRVVNHKIESSWLTVKKHKPELINGTLFKNRAVKRKIKTNRELWRTFHFSNYKLPIPMRHPSFLVIPIIKYNGNSHKPLIGFKIMNRANKLLLSIEEEKPFEFTTRVNPKNNKLFTLPIIIENIASKTIKEHWRNLFKQKLIPAPNSLGQLPYGLFILLKRIEYFSKYKSSNISYEQEKNVGLLTEILKAKNDPILIEHLFIRRGPMVYPLKIVTKNFSPEATDLRNRYLSSIKYFESMPSASHDIYKWYKTLPYKSKIDQEGMIYLFAAWSHLPSEEGFLREMIQFLERGKDNMYFLDPLYSYAYRRYGTNFSKSNIIRKETKERRFERLTKEEQEAELKQMLEDSVPPDSVQFDSIEKQIDYYIKVSKEKEYKTEDQEDAKKNSLIMY